MAAFVKVARSQTIVIGSSYIDSGGSRSEFEKIFVCESGSQCYFVFKPPAAEDV
jgi:hypothetical protein